MTNEIPKALLLLDLQRDFLAKNGRLPVAQDEVDGLLANVNLLSSLFKERDRLVVYVVNEFSPWDFPANLFRRNAALRGKPGTELDPRVHVVSGKRFSKSVGDAFSNPDLSAFLHKHEVRDVIVAGVFTEACVSRTALGARRHGFEPQVVADAVAGASRSVTDAALRRLRARGVAVTTSAELIAA